MNKSLVLFLVPPEEFIGGGIISILNLAKTSREILKNHTVRVATYPKTKSYRKISFFPNNEYIYTFDEIVDEFKTLDNLIIHIPEYSTTRVQESLLDYTEYLNRIPNLHLNVLNQNIELMPPPEDFGNLFAFTAQVTQTTAHSKYATQEMANRYSTPIHQFSVDIDSSYYKKVAFKDKEPIIAVSPDEHPAKQEIIDLLKMIPGYEVITIENLTFEDYKSLISRAKYVVTFGEGMDSYFIESTFSDTIAISVFNETFFPDRKYLALDNVYESYESMCANVSSLILSTTNNKASYLAIVKGTSRLLEKIYNRNLYQQNVHNFYKGKFLFTPDTSATLNLFRSIISKKIFVIESKTQELESTRHELSKTRENNDELIDRLNKIVYKLDIELKSLRNSTSWKITKPLRMLTKLLKRFSS